MNRLRDALSSALNLRPGEGHVTTLLLLHSFCLGVTEVSFSTAASALFLATFGAEMLPYVYMGSAGLTVFIGFLYTRLQVRLSFPTLLTTTLVFLLITVSAFRLGLWLTESKWLAFGLFFWLRLLIVLNNLTFWGLAGRLLNVRQGKRLFGVIGAGELTANILGGFATPLLVMFFGTPNLLLLSVAGLLLALGILRLTIRHYVEQLTPTSEDRGTPDKSDKNKFFGLLHNRYIVLMILSNGLMVIVYNFVDYTFFDHMKGRFHNDVALASFLGPFFAVLQIINVLTKIFISSRLFNRYGLKFGLLAHPLLLTVGSVLIATAGSGFNAIGMLFWLVALVKLSDEVFWTSIYHPTLLILYQPLRPEQRRAVPVAVQSIFGPLAIAVAGGMLLLLSRMEFFTSVYLAYLIPFILAGALIVARRLTREYIGALTQALTRRTLESVDFSLQDGSSIAVFQQKLGSPHLGEIIYALDMLERIEHESLPTFLVDLLKHPDVIIRRDVLQRIERNKATAAFDAVRQHLATEHIPTVRAAAIRAFCALSDTGSVEQVSPYLGDANPAIRMGAMVGLLRYGGIEGVLAAGERLVLAAHAPDPAQRSFAAQGLGEIGLANFYQPLVPLLQDADFEVRRSALAAAAKIRSLKLWPLVVDALATPEVATAAAAALIAGETSTLPMLAEAFSKSGQAQQTLLRIARIAGRIGGEPAIALLRQHLDAPDVSVRHRVLESLNQCAYQAQPDERTTVLQHIEEEAAAAVWAFAALSDIGHDDTIALLQAALYHEVHQARRRLFILLSFIYDRQAVMRAWEHLAHDSAEKRAYALEIIDVLLAQELKERLIPLLDDLTPAQRLHQLRERFPQGNLSCSQRLQEILTRSERWTYPWTRACALYTMAMRSDREGVDAVVSVLSISDPLLQETAMWTLAKLDRDLSRHHAARLRNAVTPQVVRVLQYIETEEEGRQIMLVTIEKVIILKTVSIFAEVPEEILAEVASILDEEEIRAGETIFAKGAMGNCLYIIVDGSVRVHDGVHTLAQLGERDIFGELALLDPEPRSASVTAIDDTRLFRLDEGAFYELMADRIEVARGIIRVLCRRVRAQAPQSQEEGVGGAQSWPTVAS